MASTKKNPLEVLQIRIADLSSELEKITVKAISKISGESKKSGKTSSKNQSNVKTIEIRLTIPSDLKLPSASSIRKYLGSVTRRGWAIILFTVIVVIIGGYALIFNDPPKKEPSVGGTAKSGPPKLERGTPPFAYVLPAGKTADALGGWARVSPPGRAPVYAYIDHIGKVQIDVSEQILPSNFKADPAAKVSELAESFNAGDKFSAAGTTIYVATKSNGAQAVILNMNKLLILISSTDALTNNQWAAYITSLR